MVRGFGLIATFVGIQCMAGGAWAATHAKDKEAAKSKSDDDVEEIESVDVGEASSTAQSEDWYGEAYPIFDRVLDHYTARSSRKGDFKSLIAHRNSEGVLRNPLRDILGFDGGGLKIGLGLRFGILDSLDIGVLRQNGTVEVFDTYEFDVRYQLLSQKKHPLDLALRGGVSWFNQPNSNAAGLFAQVLLDRLVANRLLLTASFIYHTSSSGPNKSDADSPQSSAVMAAADLRLLDSLSIDAEVTFSVAGYHDAYPIISFGPKIITNRHTFSIVLSNSQYMTTDSLIANTYRITARDWVLGFHITREI